jgi:hypothetical protein
MLRLTVGQVAALDALAEGAFVSRVVDEAVARGYGAPSDPVHTARGRLLLERARDAGFVSEFDAAAYMLCGFRYGDRFDTAAELGFCNWLGATDIDRGERSRRLHAALDDEEPAPGSGASGAELRRDI